MTPHDHDDHVTASPIYMIDDGKVVPVPEVMTEEELIRMLRLNIDGPDNPQETLAYYRDKGLLRGTRIGKRIRYCRQEVLRFLARQTDRTYSEKH